jgi:hypothetical protein
MLPNKACHNCRRRRLRCDRSLPSCRKCSTNGEECLGYGTLLRWAEAVAVRGKMAGMTTFDDDTSEQEPCQREALKKPTRLKFCPVDPLLQDMGSRSRYYVTYCKLACTRDAGFVIWYKKIDMTVYT